MSSQAPGLRKLSSFGATRTTAPCLVSHSSVALRCMTERNYSQSQRTILVVQAFDISMLSPAHEIYGRGKAADGIGNRPRIFAKGMKKIAVYRHRYRPDHDLDAGISRRRLSLRLSV